MAKIKAAPEPDGGAKKKAKTSKTAPKGGKVAKKEAKPKKEKTERKPRDHVPQNPVALPRFDPSDSQEGATFLKIISWNVGGMRKLLEEEREGILKALVDAEDPDVLVLVETKLQDKDVAKVTAQLRNVMSSNVYPTVEFACMTTGDDSNTGKLGTAGVCVITKLSKWSYGDEVTSDNVMVTKGLLTDFNKCIVFDDGGRVISLEFKEFNLICTVVPSSGEKLDKLDYRTGEWDGEVQESLRQLDTGKPTILIGDLKITPEGDKDIYNWTTAPRLKDAKEPKMCEDEKKKGGVPGMTTKERESFQEMLQVSDGFVDSFRHFHPDATGWYTHWSVRAGNRPYNAGVRSDLALVPKRTLDDDDAEVKVVDAFILDKITIGHSDHAPIGITLKICDTSASDTSAS